MERKFKIKGQAKISRIKKDGTILDTEVVDNIVVADGLERIAKLLNKIETTGFDAIGIGTGTTSATINDTELQTEVAREVATKTYIVPYKSRFAKTFTFASGVSHNITEAGVFDNAVASGSIMLDRFTFSVKVVDADTDLLVQITLTIS